MKTAVLFMSVVAASHGVSEATPQPRPAVAVRTYNYAAVSSAQLSAAQLETEHIFASAGISVVWIDCRVPGDDHGAACTETLLPRRDLMLRLVDHVPAQTERVVPLGESLLDRDQRGGVLMTVDIFPVRVVAGRTSTPVTTLLGRAVAHEIGHLLLGSARHPRLGLMRALWSHDEIRGLKPAHWGFSAREAAQMRQALLGKSPTAD